MSLLDRNSICPYRARLEAFRDDEVSPEERRAIAAHLSACAACRQHLQELQGLATVLRAYQAPPAGWSSDAEFWNTLSPQLRPRTIPAPPARATQPASYLAPLSVVVSSLALRGLAASVLVVYALHQWRLLPASWLAALTSAARLSLGPLVWQTGQVLQSNLARSPALWFAASAQLWLLLFGATVSVLLLALSGLYIGWLLRWLRGQGALRNGPQTE